MRDCGSVLTPERLDYYGRISSEVACVGIDNKHGITLSLKLNLSVWPVSCKLDYTRSNNRKRRGTPDKTYLFIVLWFRYKTYLEFHGGILIFNFVIKLIENKMI